MPQGYLCAMDTRVRVWYQFLLSRGLGRQKKVGVFTVLYSCFNSQKEGAEFSFLFYFMLAM